jgi:hypothetical protein
MLSIESCHETPRGFLTGLIRARFIPKNGQENPSLKISLFVS